MKWEYLVVFLELDRQKDLNKFGSSGWELVAIIFEDEDDLAPTAYFKRPIREGTPPSMKPSSATEYTFKVDK